MRGAAARGDRLGGRRPAHAPAGRHDEGLPVRALARRQAEVGGGGGGGGGRVGTCWQACAPDSTRGAWWEVVAASCPSPRHLSTLRPGRSTLAGIADERVKALFLVDPVDTTGALWSPASLLLPPLSGTTWSSMLAVQGLQVHTLNGMPSRRALVGSPARLQLRVHGRPARPLLCASCPRCHAHAFVPTPPPPPPASVYAPRGPGFPSAVAGLEDLGRAGRSLPLAVVGSGLGGDCVPSGERGGAAPIVRLSIDGLMD